MAETVILAEQDLNFREFDNDGILYVWEATPSVVSLTEGESYVVVWDEVRYPCKATAANFNGVDGLGLGNFALAGLGENTGESFLLGASVDGSFSACYTTEKDETNKVAIYQVVEDEEPETPPEEETPEGIVLKDRNGNDVAYYGIETVTFDTTTEGKQQVYTKGVAVEGLEIVPDFSGGDMAINAPDGTLVKSATIKKPDTLTPENVRNGVEVGGVAGTFIGDTEAVEVDLSMADGDQVVSPSAVGKVLSGVTVKKPETLIPENVAEGVDIGGIIGTLVAGGTAIKSYEKIMNVSLSSNGSNQATTTLLAASDLPEWWPAAGSMPAYYADSNNPIYMALLVRISGTSGQKYLQGTMLSNFTGYSTYNAVSGYFGASSSNPGRSGFSSVSSLHWNYTTPSSYSGLFQNANGIGLGSYNEYCKCSGFYKLILLKINSGY